VTAKVIPARKRRPASPFEEVRHGREHPQRRAGAVLPRVRLHRAGLFAVRGKDGQSLFWVAEDLCSACWPWAGLPRVVVSREFSEYVRRCRESGGTEFDLPSELGRELGWIGALELRLVLLPDGAAAVASTAEPALVQVRAQVRLDGINAALQCPPARS
jgi:hypothetical protein